MKLNKTLSVAIALYLFAMLWYWFDGDDSAKWVVFYYATEKLFSALGFTILGIYTGSKLALYCASVCIFMLLYFIFCYFYGHDTIFAVGSFLGYSFISIFVIQKNL